MSGIEVPSFDEFFVAVNGVTPLPWQRRLARQVIDLGWPELIGVPTGLGKTACIDIAIWSMAVEASTPPSERRLPTRVWYVVNRRLLVDEAADRGERLAALLANPQAVRRLPVHDGLDPATREAHVSTVERIAAALQSRSPNGRGVPLLASRLRGGLADRQLPGSPVQPAVISATVPMYGSRLLFRGYGGGRFTRSIETALAAVDSLVLLDEAHLSGPLRTLVGQLREVDARSEAVLGGLRSHPRLVALTATGDDDAERFDLDEEDLANEIVARRLAASKPTRFVSTKRSALVPTIAEELLDLLTSCTRPVAAVVFVNSPDTARKLHAMLRPKLAGAGIEDVTVVTGRMRPYEAELARAQLTEGPSSLRSGRDRAALEHHRVVIATQTLEVGADLDFDVLVTESAGVRALVQRFGRLNRLGDVPDAAAVIVHAADAPAGLYGDEPGEVWERVKDLALTDLAPTAINEVLGPPRDKSPRSPELLPNHLDEWVKTSRPSVDEVRVEPFFAGLDEEGRAARVQVAWRTYLPDAHGERGVLVPGLADEELLELPLPDLREFVESRGDEHVLRLASDRVVVEPVELRALRPGDQVLLPVSVGGCSIHGWDPDSSDDVLDVSGLGGEVVLDPEYLRHALADRGHAQLVADWVAALTRAMYPKEFSDGELPAPPEAELDAEALGALRDVADSIDEAYTDGLVPGAESARLLGRALSLLGLAVEGTAVSSPDERRWVVGQRARRRIQWVRPADDALDELSFSPNIAELAPHLRSTGDVAAALASSLGLDEALVVAVRNAGLLHDLGKAEPRFQGWLGTVGDELLAKSGVEVGDWRARRVRAGWPAGGRHEALSVRIAIEAEDALRAAGLLEPDRDLVLHLVASHHGRGRPSLLGVADDSGADFSVPIGAVLAGEVDAEAVATVSGDLSDHDWSQPRRFRSVNERYGRRGVALLEAVVRQADWMVSALSNDVKASGR